MPIYQLSKRIKFPHPSLAEEGVLAVGGDLSVERLLLAYRYGIFPWYSEGEPIVWHAPNPRFVLFPQEIKISKSMRSLMRSKKYRITLNQDFESVIRNCKNIFRQSQEGTWIIDDMEKAYINLHKRGYAHSIEVWDEGDTLVGGLYGVNIGAVFYGESMFSIESNTSKLALIYLSQNFNLSLIDCQIHTDHLESMGAVSIKLESFLSILEKECDKPNLLAKY